MRNFIKFIGAFLILALCAVFLGTSCTKAQSEKAPEITAAAWAPTYANAVTASELINSKPGLMVLDVRTPEEYARGHIPNATLINFQDAGFKTEIAKLDRDAAYIVHCQSGGRSTKSLATFKELGFTNITHLDGGFRDWQKAGLPIRN